MNFDANGTESLSHDISMEPLETSWETEFGPWMLVACRRGRGHGRSDRPRVGHMTTDEAAEKHADGTVVKESGSGSIHGRFWVRGKGGFLATRAQRNESFKIDVTPSADLSLQEKVHSDGSTPLFSRDSNVTFSGDPKPSSSRDRPMVAHSEIQSDALTPISPALGLENQLLAPRQAHSFCHLLLFVHPFPLIPLWVLTELTPPTR